MISSASTLLLATLVFNAAAVFGAPIRIMDTRSEVAVARAEISTPELPVARAAVVDVQDHRRRSHLGLESRRVARLPKDEDPEPVVPASDPASVPASNDQDHKRKPSRQRRYPRRVLHDLYEKREPATSVKETTVVVTKNTVHDTPADAAAFAAANAGASNAGASGSVIAVTATIPGLPGAANGASTILSVSQTTTIASPDASASASATTTSGAASATTSAADGGASSSASASGSASVSATATGSSTASAATATSTGAAGGGTSTDDKKGDGKTADDKKGDNKTDNKDDAAAPAVVVSANPPTAAATDDKTDDKNSRRSEQPSHDPIVRRTPAASGAAWASAIRRRQVLNSSHSI